MSEPDYAAAVKALKKHYEGLCVRVATEILGERGRVDAMLDEILEDYSRKLYAAGLVYDHLEGRVRVTSIAEARKARCVSKHVAEVPAPPVRKLRVATIHCRADIVTETINEWLARHAEIQVVSINFTQLGSGLACVILHWDKPAGERPA
ncbi:MAG: hypothetical protein ACM3U2_06330 [Deltaproteobacteria bacterium]